MQKLNRIKPQLGGFLKGACCSAIFATALAVFTIEASASEPIQLSLVPDVAIHDRNTEIEGLSLGIWSENPQHALTLGLVNGSTGQSAGFSWAYLMNYSDSYKGVQWAPVNYASGDFLGWQGGFVNYADDSMFGFQSGFINYSGHLKGLQLGFLNYAERVDKGVQIGVVNLMPENEWFAGLPEELAPGMVFVNWRF